MKRVTGVFESDVLSRTVTDYYVKILRIIRAKSLWGRGTNDDYEINQKFTDFGGGQSYDLYLSHEVLKNIKAHICMKKTF